MADNKLFGSWGKMRLIRPKVWFPTRRRSLAPSWGRTAGETVEIGGQEATIIKIN